jgi:hypothetical protein
MTAATAADAATSGSVSENVIDGLRDDEVGVADAPSPSRPNSPLHPERLLLVRPKAAPR